MELLRRRGIGCLQLHIENMQNGPDVGRETFASRRTAVRTCRGAHQSALNRLAQALRQTVSDIPEVVEFYRMTGHTVIPDIAAYDGVYKRLIDKLPLYDVTSMFAMEQIKSTTEIPLNCAMRVNEGRRRHWPAADPRRQRSDHRRCRRLPYRVCLGME